MTEIFLNKAVPFLSKFFFLFFIQLLAAQAVSGKSDSIFSALLSNYHVFLIPFPLMEINDQATVESPVKYPLPQKRRNYAMEQLHWVHEQMNAQADSKACVELSSHLSSAGNCERRVAQEWRIRQHWLGKGKPATGSFCHPLIVVPPSCH